MNRWMNEVMNWQMNEGMKDNIRCEWEFQNKNKWMDGGLNKKSNEVTNEWRSNRQCPIWVHQWIKAVPQSVFGVHASMNVWMYQWMNEWMLDNVLPE
jgi:hypothetical protein